MKALFVRMIIASILIGTVLAGCGPEAPVKPAESASRPPDDGRSRCAGAVTVVEEDLSGARADTVERLQGTYQGQPGFLAVVYDGKQGVIVVSLDTLAEWQTRLHSTGIAVARSCIEPALLADVQQVLPSVASSNGIASAGYDGLVDAIVVTGVDQDALLAAIGKLSAAAEQAAKEAIADGTLRVNRVRRP